MKRWRNGKDEDVEITTTESLCAVYERIHSLSLYRLGWYIVCAACSRSIGIAAKKKSDFNLIGFLLSPRGQHYKVLPESLK